MCSFTVKTELVTLVYSWTGVFQEEKIKSSRENSYERESKKTCICSMNGWIKRRAEQIIRLYTAGGGQRDYQTGHRPCHPVSHHEEMVMIPSLTPKSWPFSLFASQLAGDFDPNIFSEGLLLIQMLESTEREDVPTVNRFSNSNFLPTKALLFSLLLIMLSWTLPFMFARCCWSFYKAPVERAVLSAVVCRDGNIRGYWEGGAATSGAAFAKKVAQVVQLKKKIRIAFCSLTEAYKGTFQCSAEHPAKCCKVCVYVTHLNPSWIKYRIVFYRGPCTMSILPSTHFLNLLNPYMHSISCTLVEAPCCNFFPIFFGKRAFY